MGALQQVLVVDDGHHAIDHSLAAELAELGYASVTASLEAAHDVLAVIARPAAILLQASSRRDPAYAQLSERLREQMRQAPPVRRPARAQGGFANRPQARACQGRRLPRQGSSSRNP